MKITSIELSEQDIQVIVNKITNEFNLEDKKQTIELNISEIYSIFKFDQIERFMMSYSDQEVYKFSCNDLYFKQSDSELYSFESSLELYTEILEPDENNQTTISYRSVSKFSITFFYDGEEIKVNSDKIYELINKYYEI